MFSCSDVAIRALIVDEMLSYSAIRCLQAPDGFFEYPFEAREEEVVFHFKRSKIRDRQFQGMVFFHMWKGLRSFYSDAHFKNLPCLQPQPLGQTLPFGFQKFK